LLDYQEEDVEDVFGLDFTVTVDHYGETVIQELVANGKEKAVTKENKDEYVAAFVDYELNKSIQRQFEPFKHGFYFVCGGNALSVSNGQYGD
jgi:hypothetical protein